MAEGEGWIGGQADGGHIFIVIYLRECNVWEEGKLCVGMCVVMCVLHWGFNLRIYYFMTPILVDVWRSTFNLNSHIHNSIPFSLLTYCVHACFHCLGIYYWYSVWAQLRMITGVMATDGIWEEFGYNRDMMEQINKFNFFFFNYHQKTMKGINTSIPTSGHWLAQSHDFVSSLSCCTRHSMFLIILTLEPLNGYCKIH